MAFANQKGGVAKTTTTLNLGVAFQEMGRRVLVVDMDPQGNLTMSLGLDPDSVRPSMYDVLVSGVSIEEAIAHQEIDVAVASIDLAAVEIALSSLIGRERALSKALMQVRDDYDYIFIDTPPSLGLLTINALTASDAVIVPVQCEYLSLRGLAQLDADPGAGAGEPESRRAHSRDRAHHVRFAHGARAGSRGGASEQLRRSGLRNYHPQDHQVRRSAGARANRCLNMRRTAKLPKHIASLRERCSMEKRSSMKDSALQLSLQGDRAGKPGHEQPGRRVRRRRRHPAARGRASR